jgi:hypothetical protein
MRAKNIPLTASQLSYIAAIHEAGHAVVAAYLRLPAFQHTVEHQLVPSQFEYGSGRHSHINHNGMDEVFDHSYEPERPY